MVQEPWWWTTVVDNGTKTSSSWSAIIILARFSPSRIYHLLTSFLPHHLFASHCYYNILQSVWVGKLGIRRGSRQSNKDDRSGPPPGNMSSFSTLKQQRKEKEIKSHTGKVIKSVFSEQNGDTSQTSTSPDRAENHLMVEIHPDSTTQMPYHPEGLYGFLPKDLEIRVHSVEIEKGRGIYNLHQRKRGKVTLSIDDHFSKKSRRCPLVD